MNLGTCFCTVLQSIYDRKIETLPDDAESTRTADQEVDCHLIKMSHQAMRRKNGSSAIPTFLLITSRR
jgi:hypothetical protein